MNSSKGLRLNNRNVYIAQNFQTTKGHSSGNLCMINWVCNYFCCFKLVLTSSHLMTEAAECGSFRCVFGQSPSFFAILLSPFGLTPCPDV